MNTKQTLALLLSFLMAQNSSAFTVTISNLGDPVTADNAIIDNSGNFIALTQGSIGVGYFSSFVVGDFSSATRSALLSDFQQFDSSKPFANGDGAVGFFNATYDASIPFEGTSPFEGQTLFTVIGNESSLGSSTEFGVFRHDGQLFAEEDGAGNGGVSGSVRSGEGTLLLGSDAGIKSHPLGATVGTFQLAPVTIPEPSSTALLGLGSVALLLRRRR